MKTVRRKSKLYHSKYVYVIELNKDKEDYYRLCHSCTHDGKCMKKSLLECIQLEIGVLAIVWECPSFKEK